jgi:histidyl-tRNA synthetase
MAEFQRPRGTRDFAPEDMSRRRFAESRLREIAGLFGFGEVMTPIFESADLFITRSGEGIIDEMYNFQDKGGRDIALRPELTAPVMRYYVNDLHSRPKPLKLFYFGSVFRYERPQSGRYREFFHFGAELIGAPPLESDTEIIALALSCLKALGLKNLAVRIGHLGILESIFTEFGLQENDRNKARRFIDKKDMESLEVLLSEHGVMYENIQALTELIRIEGGKDVIQKAQSKIKGGDEAFIYLANLFNRLEKYGFDNCTVDFGVARGLDYYTGMVFEIDSPLLGAEKQLCGGGAYSLAELFGGEKVNSTGFAFGFDRLMLAIEKEGVSITAKGISAYIIPVSQGTRGPAFEILKILREKGISADMDIMGRSMSKALAYANSIKAGKAIIVGERELAEGSVTVREMSSGEQKLVRIEDVPDNI